MTCPDTSAPIVVENESLRAMFGAVSIQGSEQVGVSLGLKFIDIKDHDSREVFWEMILDCPREPWIGSGGVGAYDVQANPVWKG